MAEGLLAELAATALGTTEAGAEAPPPVNLSADLRNSGYKIAPIDVNLFPAGWHNLCPASVPDAGVAVATWLADRGRRVERALILAEHMTRNPAYVENLARLRAVLEAAGTEVRIATPSEEVPDGGTEVEGMEGARVRLDRLEVADGRIETPDGFRPDWALSNYDFLAGIPEILESVSTPIDPPPAFGWHYRRKRDFYAAYGEVATQAAERLGIDPWRLIPETVPVEPVDFWNREGLDAVGDEVDAMLDRIADAYRERGISDRPFVVVKDEAGTFGMGVITVDSSEPIRNPNRKLRQKMSRGKGGKSIRSVLVQEGIYTRDVLRDCVAEPVVMAAGGRMIGGFFRYHCNKDETENLNAKGMVFAKLCVSGARSCGGDCVEDPERHKVYGWLAEQVALAAGLELAAPPAG